MLAMGRSRPWQDAMEALTGQREMKADAILEYYQPLMEWLEKTNAENGEIIGWPSTSGIYIFILMGYSCRLSTYTLKKNPESD